MSTQLIKPNYLLYLLPDSRVVLSPPLERSPTVPTPDTSHISPVLRSGVVILRPSVSRECRHNQFDRLVSTQQHTVQFPPGWRVRSLPPRFFRWPTRAQRFCFVSDHMQILELGSLCGPFSVLPFCAQVCCHGPHRAAVCPADPPNKPSSSSKRSPDSPPPQSSSKSRWV